MDRFDEIWKNRFNDSKPPIETWNTPDDDLVWKGIVPHIEPKKKRRPLMWLWWSLGILISLMLVFFAYQSSSSNYVSEINQKELLQPNTNSISKKPNESIKPLQEEKTTEQIAGSSLQNELTIPRAKLPSQATKNITKTIGENKVIPSYLATQKTSNKPVSFPLIGKPMASKILLSTENKKEEKTELITSTHQTKSKIEKQYPLLPILSFEVKEAKQQESLKLATIDIIKGNKIFSVDATIGFVYWKHRISNKYISDLTPFEFNYKNNIGWQSGVKVAFSINNFLQAYGGLQYEQIQIFSGHNSLLNYNLSTEQNSSNDYTQSLATPYGLSGATFRLNRSRDVGSSSVDFLVDFESKHLIKNWTAPIGLRIIPLENRNRFQPSATIGFGFNYLSSITNQIQQIESHHDAFHFNTDGTSTFENPSINQWHYDFRLGINLHYQLNLSTQLQLNYNWAKGINAIYQQEEYNTKINRHYLSFGINKAFRNK